MVLLSWVGLNIADAILTGISFPLGAIELNPFLASIGIAFGIQRMLLIKILFAVALGGALMQRRAHGMLRLLNWAMVLVVMYNALLITHVLT